MERCKWCGETIVPCSWRSSGWIHLSRLGAPMFSGVLYCVGPDGRDHYNTLPPNQSSTGALLFVRDGHLTSRS